MITKNPIVQVCHIFPFANKKHAEMSIAILEAQHWMIPYHHMREVVKILFDEDKIDTPENMITLSLDAHYLWTRGIIAFEPYFKHEDRVVLKLRWLKTRNTSTTTSSVSPWGPADIGTNPMDVLYNYPKNIRLMHNETGRLILDGHEVEIKSTPDGKCPNWDILIFQWYLCRLSSLCAAAEALDDETEDDDDHIKELVAGIEGLDLPEGRRGRTSQRRTHPLTRPSRPSFMSPSVQSSIGERSPLRERSPLEQRSPQNQGGSSFQRPSPQTRSRSPSKSPLKTESPQSAPRRRVGGGSNQENETIE